MKNFSSSSVVAALGLLLIAQSANAAPGDQDNPGEKKRGPAVRQNGQTGGRRGDYRQPNQSPSDPTQRGSRIDRGDRNVDTSPRPSTPGANAGATGGKPPGPDGCKT